MALQLLRPGILVVGLLVVLPLRGQERSSPADQEDRAGKDEALPAGATLRLGSGIPFRVTPGFTLQPPDYTTLLVPDVQGNLQTYDVATGRARGKSTGTAVGQIVLSGDGKHYIPARTGKLAVREVKSGKTTADIDPPQGFSTVFASNAATASLSGDGTRVAQGGQSGNGMGLAVVHDLNKKEILFQAPMQYGGPVIPILSADGKYLATRRYQAIRRADVKEDPKLTFSAQVWDVDAGKELFTAEVTGGGSTVNGMAFSPDGKILAVSCGTGPVDLWDVPEGKHRATILGRMRQGMHLAFSADGKTLAGLSGQGVIQRWNAADGKPIDSTEWEAELPLTYPRGLGFAEGGRVVAWGSCGPVPVVWEAPSGKFLSRIPEHSGPIRGIAFAAGGKEIVTAGHDTRIIRWDAATGKPLGPLALRLSRPYRFTATGPIAGLSHDGTRLMTGGAVFELPSGKELFAVPGGPTPGISQSVVASPDLRMAISLAAPFDRKSPGQATVWDLTSARKLGEIEMEPGMGAAPAAVLSPEGKRLIVAANAIPANGEPGKTIITAWDLKTGKRLGQVDDVRWTGQVQMTAANESTVIVADGSGKLRRLEIERGRFGEDLEPIASGYSQPSPIVFNPDRTRFALGVPTGEVGGFGVRIHEWPSGKVLHTFKGHPAQITALSFSADGKQLASGSFDATVLVWDLEAIKPKE